ITNIIGYLVIVNKVVDRLYVCLRSGSIVVGYPRVDHRNYNTVITYGNSVIQRGISALAIQPYKIGGDHRRCSRAFSLYLFSRGLLLYSLLSLFYLAELLAVFTFILRYDTGNSRLPVQVERRGIAKANEPRLQRLGGNRRFCFDQFLRGIDLHLTVL